MNPDWMPSKFNMGALFNVNKPIIGALHFAPLVGYDGFEGMDKVLDMAVSDLEAFEEGGIDGIIIENNYDLPHAIKVSSATVKAMEFLGKKIKNLASVPVGVSVLWNDYEAALRISKRIGGSFVRVPVFVDSVQTAFGAIKANPYDVINYRKRIGAGAVGIFADIQVKHAKMINPRPISESAADAERRGADALVVTGVWTGNAPSLWKLKEAKSSTSLPVVIGSGIDEKNAAALLRYADAAIVSTSLKEGRRRASERNVKPYSMRISSRKVARLVKAVSSFRD